MLAASPQDPAIFAEDGWQYANSFEKLWKATVVVVIVVVGVIVVIVARVAIVVISSKATATHQPLGIHSSAEC